jgi:hypothetical protein
MLTKMLSLLVLASGGCALDVSEPQTPTVTLDSNAVTVTLRDKDPDLQHISVALSRFGHDPLDNAAKPDDCMMALPKITLTANGVVGTLADQGYYDSGSGGFENNCYPPIVSVEVDTRTSTLDLVLDDGTAQVDLGLTLDPKNGVYQVTQCGAAECPTF